ncbi:hypothetical protein HDU84_004162 [Entophlyctis sp. JEL0112]|nr:hypothetical protein HDU84_004162 [Entophlyctis sp. JEL0112]
MRLSSSEEEEDFDLDSLSELSGGITFQSNSVHPSAQLAARSSQATYSEAPFFESTMGDILKTQSLFSMSGYLSKVTTTSKSHSIHQIRSASSSTLASQRLFFVLRDDGQFYSFPTNSDYSQAPLASIAVSAVTAMASTSVDTGAPSDADASMFTVWSRTNAWMLQADDSEVAALWVRCIETVIARIQPVARPHASARIHSDMGLGIVTEEVHRHASSAPDAHLIRAQSFPVRLNYGSDVENSGQRGRPNRRLSSVTSKLDRQAQMRMMHENYLQMQQAREEQVLMTRKGKE